MPRRARIPERRFTVPACPPRHPPQPHTAAAQSRCSVPGGGNPGALEFETVGALFTEHLNEPGRASRHLHSHAGRQEPQSPFHPRGNRDSEGASDFPKVSRRQRSCQDLNLGSSPVSRLGGPSTRSPARLFPHLEKGDIMVPASQGWWLGGLSELNHLSAQRPAHLRCSGTLSCYHHSTALISQNKHE